MRRFARFMKDMFVATGRQRCPATAFEMTMHDALRLCADRVPNGDDAVSSRRAQSEFCRYRSEAELKVLWRRFDDAHRQTANLTIILALDKFLRGNLRELIRRRHPAYRLVLVPRAGHWPGLDSFGDLALAKHSLGWSVIEIFRGLDAALETTIVSSGRNKPLLVVLSTDTYEPRLM
jgi:hypothetical protein